MMIFPRLGLLLAVGLFLPLRGAWGQQAGKGPDPKVFEGVDQKQVDEAIESGLTHLKRIKDQKGDPKTDELVLFTMVSAGVPPDDPSFDAILKRMLAAPLEETYNVSLQAMALEKLDSRKHLPRIVECAQFLADNQARNGQWSYGQAIAPVRVPIPTTSPKASGSTRAARKIVVVPRPPMGSGSGENHREAGDFSNSQYAALGIRACHDAGIDFPREMIQRARQAWVDGQQKGDASAGSKAVATGSVPPRGWAYKTQHTDANGSMTVGGVGAVVIYDSLLALDWKRDPVVLSGIAWLGRHFSVTENPERTDKQWHHYYLYGLERVGVLFGTEKLGTNYWYRAGTTFLLESQLKGGAWRDEGNGGNGWGEALRDSCFAILFLRRATKPLVDVASVDRRK